MSKHIKSYKPHEEVMVWNEDKDLIPIEYRPPDPPPLETIEGYGLPPHEQFWRHKPLPAKLQKINDMQKDEEGNELTPRLKMKILEKDSDYYREEIDYIEKEWERRENGFWFFNNGVPTMITGHHYWQLQWWPIDGAPPDYRNYDRRWFWFWHMVYEDDNCFGFNNPKPRRVGATIKVCGIKADCASSQPYFTAGLQSKDEKHAEEVHFMNTYEPFRTVPFFFQPVTDSGNNTWKEIRFFSPTSKQNLDRNQPALNSFIDYKDSGVTSYDGTKRWLIHNDEPGKCFSINTPILMFDGSVKMVQDIVVGDLVMGPDSTSRTVLSLGRGRDTMYDVIPNKGDSWGCNQHHILSLKSATSMHLWKGVKKGDVINISVKDYLQLSKLRQKHLVQYRVDIDFPSVSTPIDPYLLGVWLGDGSSNCASINICNTDTAILNKIDTIIKPYGLHLSEHHNKRKSGSTNYNISTGIRGRSNHFLNLLRDHNLESNKHIPKEYLINSRAVRLQLLAGLIDTDGHRSDGYYEIVQVRKELSEQIVFLCQSLGYYTKLKEKKTSIKSTGFKGSAFRITIYGNNLSEIPCQVDRKKMPVDSTNKNRRNPQHVGFQLVEKGEGDYYGFTLDKDHLFLLGDFTVTHNTVEIDINERVRVQIPCLTNIERGTSRKGKMINTSTTGEMDRGGGKMFKKLCDASDYHKRDANGMTESGLYTLFQSAKEGMEGIDPITKKPFIDKFGNANEAAIERYLINKRESKRDAGDIAGYIEECRQYPLHYADCWKTSARQCIFNLLKIEERLDYYRNGNPDKIQGNFEWIAGPDSKVRWVPCDNGRWFITWNFKDPSHANRMYIDENGVKSPANKTKFIAGGDPFKFDKTKKTKRSDGAGAVFYKYDGAVDSNKENTSQWESNRFVCTYSNRPPTKEDYGEDMIMMCVYFGCEMYPEMNVTFLADYFQQRGYGGYLYYKFDPMTGKYAKEPGENTHVKQVQQIFSVIQSYIEHHALREKHDELLSQWKELVDDLQDYDLSVATGYALIGAGDMSFIYEEPTNVEPDILNYYQRFKYEGDTYSR